METLIFIDKMLLILLFRYRFKNDCFLHLNNLFSVKGIPHPVIRSCACGLVCVCLGGTDLHEIKCGIDFHLK